MSDPILSASTFAHRPLPRRMETLIGTWRSRMFGSSLPRDPETLIEAATQATGLSEFGNPLFQEGFRQVHRSFVDEAGLHSAGERMIANMLFTRLTNRLEIEETLKKSPAIRDEVIDRPIFILGMPRTASTFLQRLIASDPAMHHLRFADALTPAPPPVLSPERESARMERASDYCRAVSRYGPDLEDLHAIGPDHAEECIYLLQNSFMHGSFSTSATLPSYMRWHASQDVQPSYLDYRDQLKILQHGRPQKRWILKCISHWTVLRELLDTFPDAHVIQTHRHPDAVIPSFVNLMASARAVCSDLLIEPSIYAQQLVDSLPGILEGVHEFRLQMPAERQFDVHYADIVRNPLDVLSRLYERLGVELSEKSARSIRRWLETSGRHRLATNSYRLKSFGLSEEEVTSAFEAYIDRYISDG